uniref:Ig-like domain-containing protein n=1 Tax=Pundamilia nyererei TaxID=303518 RepID=A0A3B4F6M8_9CICH
MLSISEHMTAEIGQTITLPCQAPNNTVLAGVGWDRPDLSRGSVFLSRGEHVTYDQHPSFENRVHMQDRDMKDGDISLILETVKAADAGTYNCRVITPANTRTKTAEKRIRSIRLSVVGGHGLGGHGTLLAYVSGFVFFICIVCVLISVKRFYHTRGHMQLAANVATADKTDDLAETVV